MGHDNLAGETEVLVSTKGNHVSQVINTRLGEGSGSDLAGTHAFLHGDSLDDRVAVQRDFALIQRAVLDRRLGLVGCVIDGSALGLARDGHCLRSNEVSAVRRNLRLHYLRQRPRDGEGVVTGINLDSIETRILEVDRLCTIEVEGTLLLVSIHLPVAFTDGCKGVAGVETDAFAHFSGKHDKRVGVLYVEFIGVDAATL